MFLGIAFSEGHRARLLPFASLSRRFWGQFIDSIVVLVPFLITWAISQYSETAAIIAYVASLVFMILYKLFADA